MCDLGITCLNAGLPFIDNGFFRLQLKLVTSLYSYYAMSISLKLLFYIATYMCTGLKIFHS